MSLTIFFLPLSGCRVQRDHDHVQRGANKFPPFDYAQGGFFVPVLLEYPLYA